MSFFPVMPEDEDKSLVCLCWVDLEILIMLSFLNTFHSGATILINICSCFRITLVRFCSSNAVS